MIAVQSVLVQTIQVLMRRKEAGEGEFCKTNLYTRQWKVYMKVEELLVEEAGGVGGDVEEEEAEDGVTISAWLTSSEVCSSKHAFMLYLFYSKLDSYISLSVCSWVMSSSFFLGN